MSPEITAPVFVSPRWIPLSHRLAAIWKVLSGKQHLPQRIRFAGTGSWRVLKKAAPVVVDLSPEPSSEAPREHLCPNCSLPLHGVSRMNRPGWYDVMNGPHRPDWYDDA